MHDLKEILDAAAQGTGSTSRNPELDRIKSYFDGKTTNHFDGFGLSNDHQPYFNEKHPESARTRGCVSVEWVAFSEIMQPDANMTYIPCGISSGLRAHEAIDKKNQSHQGDPLIRTTHKADENLGPHIHVNNVIGPNKSNNLERAKIVARWQPENVIVAPVAREAAVREMARTGGFSRWQKYEEEEYMAFWYPVIDRCKSMVLDGDWNFSRNSIWEMMRGALIQAGQIPTRPNADMDVLDLKGRPVTLQARTEKLVETLKYQLGKGFEAREAATALAQIFMLDEEIRNGTIPPSGVSLHAVLKNRPSAELDAMDKMKAEVEPILQHCAQYMRLNDLPPDKYPKPTEPRNSREEQNKAFARVSFEVQVDELYKALNNKEIDNDVRKLVLEAIPKPKPDQELPDTLLTDITVLTKFIGKEYGERNDSVQKFLDAFQPALKLNSDHPLKTYESFNRFAAGISKNAESIMSVHDPEPEGKKDGGPAKRQFDSHERFFEKSARAKIFEDDLYSKLPKWETIALPFVLGATETGIYPTARPMATMIFTDLKRGKEGFDRAQKLIPPVDDMNKIANVMGREANEIIAKNAKVAEDLKAELKAENPGQIVVNTLSFLRIADTIEHFRKVRDSDRFIAEPGPSETSPEMRLALQMKYLDRNVGRAVFQEGWEHSNDLVQLRVRARMIQAGLIVRPGGDQSPLQVVSAANPKKDETLLDDINLLKKEVERCVKNEVQAPEQAIALARLVALHDMLLDQKLQDSGGKQFRDFINDSNKDTSLISYDHGVSKAVTKEAKELLTGSLEFQVGNLVNEMFNPSVSTEQRWEAAQAINKALGLTETRAITRERVDNKEEWSKKLVAGIEGHEKYEENRQTHFLREVLLDGVQGPAGGLSDGNPLKTYSLLATPAGWMPLERLRATPDAADDERKRAGTKIQNTLMEVYVKARGRYGSDNWDRKTRKPTSEVVITPPAGQAER